MSKNNKTCYVCQSCGSVHSKWSGRCDDCNQWNTLQEEAANKFSKKTLTEAENKLYFHSLSADVNEYSRIPTSLSELDRVLGGGLVQGSAILIGGDPGIGKSTLLLQLVSTLSSNSLNCAYVSGEESTEQIKLRARRLGLSNSPVKLLSATNINDIIGLMNGEKDLDLVVIDSIQTMYASDFNSAPGTVSQVKACSHELVNFAKSKGIIVLIVGHVTKDGQLAGPKVLEHMVDTVLYFEGDNNFQFRILRSMKNRFGPTNEIGVFEMSNEGLKEVINPSELFLSDRQQNISGTAIFAGLEGTRPILIEVQALVTPSTLVSPRRTIVGWDIARLSMLCAVLESRCKIHLSNMDIYLNIAGGIKIFEPAADLAVAAAIISSIKNVPISYSSVFFGEVGLSGEIRKITQPELRIKEAKKLGFKNITLPTKQKVIIEENMSYNNITILRDLVDLINNDI